MNYESGENVGEISHDLLEVTAVEMIYKALGNPR
jgi:hypothetical protein